MGQLEHEIVCEAVDAVIVVRQDWRQQCGCMKKGLRIF